MTFTLGLSALKVQAQVFTPSLRNQFAHGHSLQSKPDPQRQDKDKKDSEEEPIDFSSSGRSGQHTAGESRGGCPHVSYPLSAISPNSHESKTVASHPQWLFYIPYEESQISKIEFVIQDKEEKDILRTNLLPSNNTPYLSATIPETHPGLVTNKEYIWYFKVNCVGGENTVPLFVSGSVQRVLPDE